MIVMWRHFLVVMVWLLSVSVTSVVADVQHGHLVSDTTWQGEVVLVGDVVVPEGITLTLSDGLRLLYAEHDVQNFGKDADRPELVVYGNLVLPDKGLSLMPPDTGKVLYLQAPEVDTTPYTNEFVRFRNQYYWLWSVVGLCWTIAGAMVIP